MFISRKVWPTTLEFRMMLNFNLFSNVHFQIKCKVFPGVIFKMAVLKLGFEHFIYIFKVIPTWPFISSKVALNVTKETNTLLMNRTSNCFVFTAFRHRNLSRSMNIVPLNMGLASSSSPLYVTRRNNAFNLYN